MKSFFMLVVFVVLAAIYVVVISAAEDPCLIENGMTNASGLFIQPRNSNVPLAPVSLVVDDGSVEESIGIGESLEFMWLNRFTPDPGSFPFNLYHVQIYFPLTGGANVGDNFMLVVYENTSGNTDPAIGSNWLASFPVTLNTLGTWNGYDFSSNPVTLNGPGDVLIGVIGLELPGTAYNPAALDTTTPHQRSWAGWWTTSPPPNPPVLPPNNAWTLIDDFLPGNWMIRGLGETITPSTATPTPTAGPPTFTPLPTMTPPPDPTFTSTPTNTPVPPTETPEPECNTLGVTIWMPSDYYQPGDEFECIVYVCNTMEDNLAGYPLFVILDVFGQYFFAPSFGPYDNYLGSYPVWPHGETEVTVIPMFTWPQIEGSATGIIWYAALTNPSITGLFGAMDTFTFGWGQ